MEAGNPNRSKKVVGLFLAATLAFTPGCSMNPFNWGNDNRSCTDANRDGYCDEDGRPVPNNRSSRTGFWPAYRSFGGGSGSSTSTSAPKSGSSGVSSGSKSGIGSSSRSGGGSSGG